MLRINPVGPAVELDAHRQRSRSTFGMPRPPATKLSVIDDLACAMGATFRIYCQRGFTQIIHHLFWPLTVCLCKLGRSWRFGGTAFLETFKREQSVCLSSLPLS